MVTGWVTRFFPYLKNIEGIRHPNPMLDLPIDEPKNITKVKGQQYTGPGLSSRSIPATLSRVVLNVVDRTTHEYTKIDLVAGVFAVAQDADGALRPIAGWSIEPGRAQISDVLDRIERDHVVVKRVPAPAGQAERWRYRGGIAEIVAFDSRFEAATLVRSSSRKEPFLTFRAGDARVRVKLANSMQFYQVEGIADFADGRMLCVVIDHCNDSHICVVCRVEHAAPSSEPIRLQGSDAVCLDTFDSVTVLAGTLADVLDACIDADGDFGSLATGRKLTELLPPHLRRR
ncbi:MAG: DUF4419 domain-containing protein [Kofleriaceae bacterium]